MDDIERTDSLCASLLDKHRKLDKSQKFNFPSLSQDDKIDVELRNSISITGFDLPLRTDNGTGGGNSSMQGIKRTRKMLDV